MSLPCSWDSFNRYRWRGGLSQSNGLLSRVKWGSDYSRMWSERNSRSGTWNESRGDLFWFGCQLCGSILWWNCQKGRSYWLWNPSLSGGLLSSSQKTFKQARLSFAVRERRRTRRSLNSDHRWTNIDRSECFFHWREERLSTSLFIRGFWESHWILPSRP